MNGPVYHDNVVQGTKEWDGVRAGKWSGSTSGAFMGGTKKALDDMKTVDDLVKRLAWERAFGPTEEPRYESDAMRRGHEYEGVAREWIAFQRDAIIGECGFVDHGRIPNFGVSPDGFYLPDRKRGVEIKCLLHKAYMHVLETRAVPSTYVWQVRCEMMVADLDELDFVVFHPGPGGLVITVERDKSFDDQIEARIALLEPKVQAHVERLLEFKNAGAIA